jgi:hypothetical protein
MACFFARLALAKAMVLFSTLAMSVEVEKHANFCGQHAILMNVLYRSYQAGGACRQHSDAGIHRYRPHKSIT